MTQAHARRALTIGVSRFQGGGSAGSNASTGSITDASELPDLPFAPALVNELAAALAALGYHCTVNGAKDLSTATLGTAVNRQLGSAERDAVLGVHVLSHGQAAAGGATVYVLGSDGVPHPSSDVAHWLTSAQNMPDGPLTLFLLDLCESGGQARLAWQAEVADGRSRAWVIAACRGDEAAYDGRFTHAVTNVLRAIAAGDLYIDPACAHVPLETVARAVRREVHRLAGDGYRQQVTGSLVDISAEVDLPFFPNPAHDPGNPERQLRARLDPGLLPFLDDLDEGLDARHFVDRAAGVGVLTGPGTLSSLVGCFTGRDQELKRLSPWLNRVGRGNLGVVTGSPGVGKSALLGVLVCAAHPRLRPLTGGVWNHVAQAPYPIESAFAAVHARQRSLPAIVASLARQLGLGGTGSAAELIEQVLRLPEPAMIVIDALDEADDGVSVMTELLLPLAHGRASGPAPRVLVGTRRYPDYAPLLTAAKVAGMIVDLDDIPRDVLEKDLNRYVYELLGATGEYRGLGAVRGGFATTVARTLAAPPTEPLDRRWGEFLVAGLYTRYLITSHREPVSDVVHAEGLGSRVPRTLPEVLELDLAAQPGHRWLRPVMAVLAHAHGNGMPASVLARAAAAFGDATGSPTPAQLRGTLETGRFYLRQSTDSDHTTLYRLFHQGLADYLRRHPRSPLAASQPGDLRTLLELMLEPLGPPAARDWRAAEPYLLRHALQHADTATEQNELLADPGFLLAADLTAVENGDPSGSRQRLVTVRRATLASTSSPVDQPAALALNAARARLSGLASRAANPPGRPPLTWQPQWTMGRPRISEPATPAGPVTDAGHVDLDGGHLGPVTAAACANLDGRPVAITGGADHNLRIWDLASHQQIDKLPDRHDRHDRPITGIGCVDVGSGPMAVTIADGDSAVSVWDLRERRSMFRLDHHHTVAAVACATVDDRAVAVVANGCEVQLWDLRTQRPIGGPMTGHTKAVTTVACAVVAGRPVAVTGGADRTVRLWDLRSGVALGEPLTGHRRGIVALDCTVLGGQPFAVTVGAARSLRMWDLAARRPYGAPLRTAAGWSSPRTRLVACAGTLALTDRGQEISVWDLLAGRELFALALPSPPNAVTCATVQGQLVAVVGDAAGSVRLWKIGTEPPSGTCRNRTDDRLAAVLASLSASTLATIQPDSGYGLGSIQHLTLTADRRTALVADSDGVAVAVELSTGAAPHGAVHRAGGPLTDIWTEELAGRQVAVLAGAAGTRVWDLADGGVIDASGLVTRGSGSRPALDTAALLDGTLITITGHHDGTIRLQEAATRRSLGYLLPGHDGPVTALTAFEFDGQLLAFSGGADSTVCVWDVATRRCLDTIEMLGEVTAIETTAQGYLLVAAGGEVIALRHVDALRGRR